MEQKIKVVISGCCGRMGQILLKEIKKREDMVVVAGLSRESKTIDNLQVFSYDNFNVDHDVIIDFSHKDVLDNILKIAEKFNSKLVICTTGYTPEQLDKIKKFASNHAVFLSSNTSLGINLLLKLSKIAKNVLGDDFDIEIIEKHHNKKIDAPSGTALSIAKELSDENTILVFDRSKENHIRRKNEIGIQSIRGGNITGEHAVLFISNNEILKLEHTAYSREIYVSGAIRAMKDLSKSPSGFYTNF